MARGMARFYQWTRCARSVWDRNWFTAVLRWRGRKLTNEWKRANREFLSRFNPLFLQARALAKS